MGHRVRVEELREEQRQICEDQVVGGRSSQRGRLEAESELQQRPMRGKGFLRDGKGKTLGHLGWARGGRDKGGMV